MRGNFSMVKIPALSQCDAYKLLKMALGSKWEFKNVHICSDGLEGSNLYSIRGWICSLASISKIHFNFLYRRMIRLVVTVVKATALLAPTVSRVKMSVLVVRVVVQAVFHLPQKQIPPIIILPHSVSGVLELVHQ